MKTELAERLLIKIMNWTADEVSKERPLLQALAQLKYDEYQQFSTGTRYIESLVKWLGQFENFDERRVAYNFIKSQLIFISTEQVSHLVNIAFSEKINPLLISQTAKEKEISEFLVNEIVNSNEYAIIKRGSLFIGLSDGARIDQLRRSEGLNNEQVLVTYDVSESKVTDLLKELDKTGGNKTFNTIFLIDDFTASGTSYFRKEDDVWKGKIAKFLKKLFIDKEHESTLVDRSKEVNILILFYIATEISISMLKEQVNVWMQENYIENVKCDIECLQLVDSKIKDAVLEDNDFIELCEKYFDNTIVDRHWKKAKHDNPYLGYGECALPVVLNHNTPNNSLPILWLHEGDFIGLFPRVTRHKK